jgi:holo-[acyl-carrier protein] synthase
MGSVIGIGIDLVDIERFERVKPRVRERLFTPAEAKYCVLQRRPALHFAARFAATARLT